jgi:hypothetical protein
MLNYINFHSRSSCQPLAYGFDLGAFKSTFAMRARTQLRPTNTFSAQIRVDSDDGFALAIYEVGTANGTSGDTFYSAFSVVAKLAFPQPTACQSFYLPTETTFQADKIYVFDLKYYDIGGDKCIKVRTWPVHSLTVQPLMRLLPLDRKSYPCCSVALVRSLCTCGMVNVYNAHMLCKRRFAT